MSKRALNLFVLVLLVIPNQIFGHSGRTDSHGGHNDNINGGYHYHNGGREALEDSNNGDYDFLLSIAIFVAIPFGLALLVRIYNWMKK